MAKSVSYIDTGRASIGHGAKTDSDPARPPGGDHPATQQASPGVLTRGAARRGHRTLHVYSTYAHGPLRPSRSGIDSFLNQSDFKDVVESRIQTMK
jgi:hypothetical protein